MNTFMKTIIWQQFGAAIDTLEQALVACPEELWGDRSRRPEYWYTVYHTLFWLDLYLFGPAEGFEPPAPFGLEELDPAGVLPERVYSKEELLNYLEHGRKKCWITIETLPEEKAQQRFKYAWGEASFAELLLYNMRHVQHHAAQLNLILRQGIDAAPRWVAKAKEK
ncbi:MAG: DinB family protein [Planctomycetota bacterium]|jgi:hypothetical protein